MKERVARLLASRSFLWIAVFLAVGLLLPTLRIGFMMDDYAQPSWLRGEAARVGGPRGIWDLFRFQDGSPGALKQGLDEGYWPWWTNPEMRLAFFRPLTSLTHAFDYRFFPKSPALMRLESILMYGAAVLGAGLFYRRLLGATAAAGLALLMFSIDDAHAATVTWISNRNAVLAAALGFFALLLHDRGVRDADRRARIASPIVFGLAILAGEAALATLGYIVAHALWLQRESLQKKVLAVLPYAFLALVWSLAYKAAGYGAWGGEFYIDPGKEPFRFLRALVTRLPILLHGQVSFPPSDMWLLVPFEKHMALFPFVLAVVLLGAAVLGLGVRRTRENGFFATGMLLALVPVCATFPGDRLLLFAGLGAFGLVADFLTAPWVGLPLARRRVLQVAAVFFVLLHIVVAPIFFAGRAVQTGQFLHEPIERGKASLPSAAELENKTVVFVNAPDFLIPMYSLLAQFEETSQRPARFRQLAIAVRGDVKITRTGERTFDMTLSEGFFQEPFSMVFRKIEVPPQPGEVISVLGMKVTAKELVPSQKRVQTFEFAWDVPAESPEMVWLIWQGVKFERFTVPAVGQSVTLPAIDYQKALGGS